MTAHVRVVGSMAEIARDAWDALHTDRDSPFVEWEWLHALEQTGCVSADVGWLPQHLTYWRDGQLVAAAPAYVKAHSEGEFVYDWSWADVARRMGIAYYPKLVMAVPFTPATGSRLLRAPGESLEHVASVLGQASIEVAKKHGLSGAHWLFPHEAEVSALERVGFMPRLAMQFHWHNEGYATPDDFLARFQSKRRTALKRERAQIARDGMTIETLRGDAITPDLIDPMVAFYSSTIEKFYYGRQYLTRAFFERVVERFRHRLEWVIARDPHGVPIAGAFNVRRGSVLYGRYWGAIEDRPFLHFNVCFYHSIDEAIRTGVQTFEPGAGGEHKLVRGFEPTLTHSAHWIANPRLDGVLRDFLSREGPAVREHVATELAESPLRPLRAVQVER